MNDAEWNKRNARDRVSDAEWTDEGKVKVE